MAYWYLMLLLCWPSECRKKSWLEAYRACRNSNKSLPCVSKTDFLEIPEKQRNANFSSVWINNDVIVEYKSLRLGCTVDVRCNPSTAEECINKLTLHHRTNRNRENCCSKNINLYSVDRCEFEIQNAYIYDLNITQCSMIIVIGDDICLVKTDQCNAEISNYICVEGGDKCDLEIRKQGIKAGSVPNTEPTQTRCIRRDNTTRDSAIKTSTVTTNSTVTVDISVDITQQPPHKNLDLTAAIIVPVVIVFIALALVGIILFHKRCKAKKRRRRNENSLPSSNVIMSRINQDGAYESEYTEIKEADMHPISGSDANSNKKDSKNIEQPDAQNNYFILEPELNNRVDIDDNEYVETVVGEYDDLRGKSDRKRQKLADQNHIYAHGQTVVNEDTTYDIANSRPSEVDKSEYDTTGHV